MADNLDFGSISFDLPKNQSNVIKVIGVGGGGSNAINHMFRQGIKGVDFVVCNTDAQALQNSPVPNKIQLGVNLTEGLGAGANPEVGQQSAIESISEIEKMLDTNTKMVFITAGMGGGTGTGAAPVIAQLAKERDILTVGIVTIPFQFEGKVRSEQALIGVEKLRKQVDSLVVINNNKLREVYGNLGFKAGFSKADEVLATASRGIAEVITHHYTQNIDLKDAKTVLSNSGTAIMGSAVAEGENRAKEAIVDALDSPLLNDNKITGAKNVLLLIVSGTNEITIDEIGEINDHIQSEAGYNANIIMGVGEDESLGEAISVTIIATGFNVEQQKEIVNAEPRKIIHPLEEEQRIEQNLINKIDTNSFNLTAQSAFDAKIGEEEKKVVFNLEEELPVMVKEVVAEIPAVETPETPKFDLIPTSELIKNIDVVFEIVEPVKEQEFVITPVQQIVEEVAPMQNTPEPTFAYQAPVVHQLEEEPMVFELTSETKNIVVNEHQVVKPMPQTSQDGVIRYSLEEYMEIEKELFESKPLATKQEVVKEDESLQFTMKSVVEKPVTPVQSIPENMVFEEVSPVEMSIEDALRARADERRRKMKEFNYKFHNASKVDDLEREPAYKRLGFELTERSQMSTSKSRMSLGADSNDDLQLRTNNSFLHDNVD